MEYIAIIAILIILLVISERINEKKRIARMKDELTKSWGSEGNKEYSDVTYDNIRYYYRNKPDEANNSIFKIDDITWNDLDLDTIYKKINSSSSSIGSEYLYSVMRENCLDNVPLLKRKEAIDMFTDDADSRIKIQMCMAELGTENKISIYKYIKKISDIQRKSTISHYIQALCLLLSVISIFLGLKLGIALTFLFLIINVATYYVGRANIEPYLKFFSYVICMTGVAQNIIAVNNDVIGKYSEKINECTKSLSKLNKVVVLLAPKKPSGSISDMFLDYIKMMFHIDIITFYKMLRLLQDNSENIYSIYEFIGWLDSMCVIASYRAYLNDWCEPELIDGNIIYVTDNIYHPLIKNPIKNTIAESGCVLLTGSNASGKSTFLKTLALNAIFAQTIYTCTCSKYKGCFYKVFTSMALKDNIENSESYYMVEIKSLKRIIDNDANNHPILCFVDEVLRGTNTLERIAASSVILKTMSQKNFMCFSATHDIELTQILSEYYTNYHFQENVQDDDIMFDYILKTGPATSKNAIKLLGIIGYSDEIITNATNQANLFLKNGYWNNI